MMHEYRLIAVMHDGTVVEKDFTPKEHDARIPVCWFDDYKTVQMANLVVCIHLTTGRTEMIKNRWGDSGFVERKERR